MSARLLPMTILSLLFSISSFSSSFAQWSSDPATNLSIADAASDQILPKVSPTSTGGCWISWFDGIANGFDVRIQLLDAGGNELLAHRLELEVHATLERVHVATGHRSAVVPPDEPGCDEEHRQAPEARFPLAHGPAELSPALGALLALAVPHFDTG